MIHAAQAMGLGSAPMIGFDAPAVAEAFALAADEIPVLLLAIGHAMPQNWPRKPRKPRKPRRPRRPLAQVLQLV